MMKEDTTYCRLREERTFLSKEKEKRDSSPSSLPSFSLSDLTIFTSYASSPSLFSPASFSLPLSSSKCSSFSLPLHPRTQIFLTRILTELPQLKLHVSSVISSSLSSSCHPGKSSRDHLSSSSSFSCSSSSSQYPSLSFHAVRSVQEKERCVLGEGDESRERRGTSFRDVPKTSSYTLEEREEKVFITAERRANRHEEKEEEKKKVKSHGDILSAVLIKIPDGLEEAIAKQRNLTKRHTRDSEESSSSSTREEREREQEKGKEKEDERVTRLHVYGGFSLRVYIHLETLLSTVGITTPWHEEREEEEEKEKKKDEEREKASSSSILDSFFSHLFLDFSLEVYSDYPFTSPSIFFHRILYREDTEHLPKGELSSSAFLPLSEKIRNLALSEIAAEDKQRRDLSAGFLRELATPSSSSRIFLSFLDQVIRHLEETLSRFSFSFPENESLTHQVLGEEWTPSLSLVLLVRRLCSFITLVYIQLSRDGAFHEKITTSSQDEEKDLPHPVHEKNTRTEKKEKEEKEEEDERSSKGMDERRRQENGICSLTQESSAPFDHAHHHKPWRDSHLQENFSSDSSSSFSSSSPPYPSSSCLSCTSSPCLSFRERRRRRCPMICRLVRSSWRMRGACILFVWLAGVLLRASVGLYPYSGEGEIKTGYGDFEAQRHWMEIAFNLPISTWYTYGTCHHDDFHDDQPRHSHSVHHTNHTDSSSSSPYSSSSLSSSSSVAVSRHPKVVWWPLDYPPLSAFLAQFFSFFSFLSYPPSVLFWTWRLPPEEIKGKDISEGGIDIKKLTNGTSGNLVSSSSSSSPSYPSSSSSHLTSSSLSSLSPSFPASSSSSSSSSFSWLAEGLHYSSSSRGVEDSFFRVFMRWSVIACDLLLFFSLLFFFSSPRTLSEKREMKRKTERHPSTSRTFVSLHKEAFSVSSFFLGEERPPKERTDGQQQQEEERREFQSRGLDQRRSAESEEKEKKESPWKEEETDDERIGAKEKEKERRDTLFPSSSSFFSCGCPPEAKAILLPLILCFFSPPLLLVDHLHFQYNNVALSLVITAAAFILRHRDYLASICFTSAILFKQTSLYYAPAFFSILLARATKRRHRRGDRRLPTCEWMPFHECLLKIFSLGFLVLSVTFLVLLPFLLFSPPHLLSCQQQSETSLDISQLYLEKDSYSSLRPFLSSPSSSTFLTAVVKTLSTIYRRIFPFHRGLFEDYVANCWVVSSPFLRIREKLSAADKTGDHSTQSFYMFISMILTLLGFLPACIGVYRHPTQQRFLQALFCSSSSFFLFSWMVHEKAILLPVTAILLSLFSQKKTYDTADFGCLYTLMATFSLLHLMQKDKAVFPWSLLVGFFFFLSSRLSPHLPLVSFSSSSSSLSSISSSLSSSISLLQKKLACVSKETFNRISAPRKSERDSPVNVNKENKLTSYVSLWRRCVSSFIGRDALHTEELSPLEGRCGAIQEKKSERVLERHRSLHVPCDRSFVRKRSVYRQSFSSEVSICLVYLRRLFILVSRWVYIHLRNSMNMMNIAFSPLSFRLNESQRLSSSSASVETRLSSSSSFPFHSSSDNSIAYILKERRENSSQLTREKKEISRRLLRLLSTLLSLLFDGDQYSPRKQAEEEQEERKDDFTPSNEEEEDIYFFYRFSLVKKIQFCVLGVTGVFAALQIFANPPKQFPYLFVYLNCCLHFLFFFFSLVMVTGSIWISPVGRSEEGKGTGAEDVVEDTHQENDESLLNEVYEPLYQDEHISSCHASSLVAEDVFFSSSELLVIPSQDGYATVRTLHHSVKRKEEKGELFRPVEGVRHRGRTRETKDVQNGWGDS